MICCEMAHCCIPRDGGQDDSEDSETEGDEEDGSQSSTNLQAASRFHRYGHMLSVLRYWNRLCLKTLEADYSSHLASLRESQVFYNLSGPIVRKGFLGVIHKYTLLSMSSKNMGIFK